MAECCLKTISALTGISNVTV